MAFKILHIPTARYVSPNRLFNGIPNVVLDTEKDCVELLTRYNWNYCGFNTRNYSLCIVYLSHVNSYFDTSFLFNLEHFEIVEVDNV